MRICSVTDGYIAYLRTYFPHVYMNKEETRIHTRKYVGVVIAVNEMNYYVPLSSPKEGKDYELLNDNTIKAFKNSFTVFRICSKSGIKGTLQFAYMIPVPENAIIDYDVNEEDDEDYKNLVREEIEYLRKNEAKIRKRASIIYTKKTRGDEDEVLKKCLDFQELEKCCATWQRLVKVEN